MVAELVSLSALSYLPHQGKLSSTTMGRSPCAVITGGRVSSSALMPSGQAQLHPHLQSHCAAQSRHKAHSPSACEGLGHLSWLTQPFAIRAIFTVLPRWGTVPILLSVPASDEGRLAFTLPTAGLSFLVIASREEGWGRVSPPYLCHLITRQFLNFNQL